MHDVMMWCDGVMVVRRCNDMHTHTHTHTHTRERERDIVRDALAQLQLRTSRTHMPIV